MMRTRVIAFFHWLRMLVCAPWRYHVARRKPEVDPGQRRLPKHNQLDLGLGPRKRPNAADLGRRAIAPENQLAARPTP